MEGSQRRDTVGKKEGSRTNPGKLTKLYDGISKGESSATKRGSRHKKTKWKDFSKGSRDIDESSSTIERRKSIMPGPQRTGTFLTIQSLQEFEKSPQGMDCHLHVLSITGERISVFAEAVLYRFVILNFRMDLFM